MKVKLKVFNIFILYVLGQGHCLATIDGGYGGDDIGNAPIYPIQDEYSNRRGDQKIISTEGCFSCKVCKIETNIFMSENFYL